MNHKKFSSLLLAIVCVALLFPGAYGRPDQQSQEQTLKLRTELVQFDVLVTDKNDRPVRGLTKDDFVLLDAGKPQDISFFSFVDVSTATQGKTAEPSLVEDPAASAAGVDTTTGRTIFIILDPYFIGKTSYPALNKSLARLIDEDLLPGDQVAIISTNGALAGFQQATKNKKALMLAIQAFLGNGVGDYGSLATLDAGFAAAQQDIGMAGASAPAQYTEQKLRDTLRTLVSVVKAASDVPGRKIAFFITENLPVRISDSAMLSGSSNLLLELDEVISQSRKGGMTFYTMDPRGLVAPIPGGSAAEVVGRSALSNPSPLPDPGASADTLLGAQEGLRTLAAGTGGYAILNNNDLHVGLQRVMSQNSSYYVLAYYPADLPDKQQFRKVKIQIKGRPDLRVSNRTGYLWTGSGKGVQRVADPPKEQRVSSALAATVPVRDIRVNLLQAEVVKDPKTGELLAKMVISIDPNTWPFKAEGADHLAAFEVDGFAYDLSNKLIDGYSKEYSLRLKPETFPIVMKQGMNLHGEIKLKKSGLVSLRVVVIDKETNRLGSATEWVVAK
ncbi:MAG TPA: VWA domain-containing protein [Blastocatellia bacterium]|nr:VWA domain-containing protein [Blastocatellia bacterium]